MQPMIFYFGWLLIAISGVGSLTSAYMEWKKREPIYMVLMKIFSLLLGVGGVLVGLGGVS
ncbi:MAG: hypothetical protein DRP11_00935 [Candidatus Aenigmatarchaeota archaeon]|nr:MAG: hypothetical protein DRP11_00935 [Candidatus Aenigmarchaeota archaeon]